MRTAAASAPLVLLLVSASGSHQSPHLVFIMVDDLGWNDVGFHDPRIRTPTLDKLASEGVLLERHYVYRYCSPTRWSFLSGRFAHHDHQSNPGGQSPFGPNINMTLLPAKLKEVGYRTAYRGKWHYGFSKSSYLPVARGFEDAAGYLQGACDHLDETTGCAVDSWRSNSTHSGPDTRNNSGYDSFRHAADMVAIIERQSTDNRPLFLYAALHVAHQPLEAPASFIRPYDINPASSGWCSKKKTIAGMASVADNVTAELVTALQTSTMDMWNNTVLVLLGDNGGPTFEDKILLYNHTARTHARTN